MASGSGSRLVKGLGKFFVELRHKIIAGSRWRFHLGATGPSGYSYAEIYSGYLQKTGKKHPKDNPVDFPPEAEHIWRYWIELNKARQSNGFGINTISWLELDAWSRMTNTDLEPWEINAIFDIDAEYLQLVSEQKDIDSKRKR